MATWHQNKANRPLWHPTKWTVIIDPPNQLRTGVLCDTRQSAESVLAQHKARGEKHVYIIDPHR